MNFLKLNSIIPKINQIRQLTSTTKLYQSSEISADDDMPIEMKSPFEKEKQQCILCKMKIEPDYKNVKLLSQFVSPFTGRIYGRHVTGLCRKKHEKIYKEIVKAQNAAFMPYYNKEAEFLEDPKLFNPERPIRPHSY